MIHDRLSTELISRLGWTLLHSLWQLTLLGLLLGIVLALCARRSARVRYGLACSGLLLMLASLAITFSIVPPQVAENPVVHKAAPSPQQPIAPDFVSQELLIADSEGSNFSTGSESILPETWDAELPTTSSTVESTEGNGERVSSMTPWMPWIVGSWLVGVSLLGIWNLGGWFIVQRLRSTATMPVANHVRQRTFELAQRMRLTRPIQLVESMLIEVPMTIGWIKPMILLPASLVTGLTQSQLDAVLTHELAHIRRHDYLVNLLQSLAESLLFYHPAVWWVSRRIRVEREFCCDDEAIATSGDKPGYIDALATIEHQRGTPAHALSLLGPQKGLTLERIQRIMGISTSRASGGVTGIGTLLLILGVGIGVAFSQQQNPAIEPTSEEIATFEEEIKSTETDASQNRQREANPPHNATAEKREIDLETFQIDLDYVGESDKPFYRASIGTRSVESDSDSFSLNEKIDRETALQLVSWLEQSGYFDRAIEDESKTGVANQKAIPKTNGPKYVLRFRSGEKYLVEDLGWELGMLLRLESLREVLDEESPDTPTVLDRLLERLSGQRRIWIEGQTEQDLQVMFSVMGTEFDSGNSIPVRLVLTNTGNQIREYEQHSISRSGYELRVYDSFGRRVPFLAGPSQLLSRQQNLAPLETVLLEEFDLASIYYLRKPGTYSACYVVGDRRSNRIEFTVTPGDDDDPDIVGKLLPLVHDRWVLIANPNQTGKVRPGHNFEEVDGVSIIFHDNPTGSKRDVSLVWLWFTDEKAKPSTESVENNHPPASTYIGVIGGKHLYVHRDEKSLERWPNLLVDVREAFGEPREMSSAETDDTAEVVEESSESNRRRKKNSPISRLVEQINASHGLLLNGSSPAIELPEDAKPEDVLKATVKALSSYDRIEPYKIIDSGEVTLDAMGGAKYFAMHIESNLGPKILLCQYVNTNNWWARFYDVPAEGESSTQNEQVLEEHDSIQPVQFAESPRMQESLRQMNVDRKLHQKMQDLGYQIRHDEYKALILEAIKAKKLDQVEKLTEEFNRSIGGNLAYVEVLSRSPERQAPLMLFNKTYGDRKFQFANSGVLTEERAKDSSTPRSSVNYFSLGHYQQEPGTPPYEKYALVRTMGISSVPLGPIRWPDDLEIRMAIVAQNEWGMPNEKVLTRLRAPKLNWRSDETPRFELDVRNSSDKDISFIPHQSVCEIECDGVWYVWGAPVAWGGPANVFPPQSLKSSGINLKLVHDTEDGWVSKNQRKPLQLNEGIHTIRIALQTAEGPTPVSNAITIGVGSEDLIPEQNATALNQALQKTERPKFEIKPVENPIREDKTSVGLFHNGGFETPDHYNSLYNVYFVGPLGGWKVERGSVEIVTKYWTPAEGNQSLDLSGFQNKPGTISQEIVTVPGRKYRVRFSAAANPEPDDVATLKQMKVFWGESESQTLEFDAKGCDFKNVGWKVYEFEALATAKKTRLAFESLTQTPCGPILDDISVIQISE